MRTRRDTFKKKTALFFTRHTPNSSGVREIVSTIIHLSHGDDSMHPFILPVFDPTLPNRILWTPVSTPPRTVRLSARSHLLAGSTSINSHDAGHYIAVWKNTSFTT